MISDREFWMMVRMALLQVCRAIEKRWMCKDSEIIPLPQQGQNHAGTVLVSSFQVQIASSQGGTEPKR